MDRNKAMRPDRIVIEMLSTLDKFAIDKINKIYDIGDRLEDPSRPIFIIVPKKLGANKCKLYWNICLMNHISKLIIWILVNRAYNSIRPETWQGQCSLLKTLEYNL